jgi:DNA repair protein RecN (Recombination protein N)
MIRQLSIRNLALVERLTVDLGPGLNLLTGETGSGKSIIVDALGLALGDRASPEQVRAGSESGSVEAVFEVDDETAARLAALGHETEDGMLALGREVTRAGRSTARVGGRMVPRADLREVADLLVDVHGQREHQSLLQRDRLLLALDRFAGSEALARRAEVGEAYGAWTEARAEAERLSRSDESQRRELELLRFQLEEIEAAAPRLGEDVELAAERETLANAERLREAAASVASALGGGEDAEGALEAIYRAEAAARGAAEHDARIGGMVEQLGPLAAELAEIRRGAVAYLDSVQADPARLAVVEERLERLRRLIARHPPSGSEPRRRRRDSGPAGAPDGEPPRSEDAELPGGALGPVLEHAESARRRLAEDERRDEALAEARRREAESRTALAGAASALRRCRQEAAERLARRIEAEIAELNMERARVEVALPLTEAPGGIEIEGREVACGPDGAEDVELLLAANPGEPLLPLQRVGSGGEVSRVMLALRGVMAGADRVPTIVLDEIDVGIGGRTATRLGERLRGIAADRQVVCVTHLAAVAALADRHLAVRKELVSGRHVVAVEALDGDARVAELARLLAGDRGGEAAVETARSLLAASVGAAAGSEARSPAPDPAAAPDAAGVRSGAPDRAGAAG